MSVIQDVYIPKVTSNPSNTPDPKLQHATQHALDHYLSPATDAAPEKTALFRVTCGVNSEILIVNSYETVSSVSALLLDLFKQLTGKDCDVTLAIHQLSELSVLLLAN